MKFGSRQYFQYLEEIQNRSPFTGENRARHSSVEVGGALGLVRVTFETRLSPQLRRAIIRGFFRHNKGWLRYFRSIAFRHLEGMSVDPNRPYARGFPLFKSADSTKPSARLGFEIQLLRLKVGLTQAELSRRTGIPQSYISQIERGTVTIREDTRLRILQAMEVRRKLTAEDYLLCE